MIFDGFDKLLRVIFLEIQKIGLDMFTLIPKYRSAEVLVQSSTQIFSSCYRDYCMTHHTPQGESDLHWPPKILSGKSLFTQSQN